MFLKLECLKEKTGSYFPNFLFSFWSYIDYLSKCYDEIFLVDTSRSSAGQGTLVVKWSNSLQTNPKSCLLEKQNNSAELWRIIHTILTYFNRGCWGSRFLKPGFRYGADDEPPTCWMHHLGWCAWRDFWIERDQWHDALLFINLPETLNTLSIVVHLQKM